MTSVNCIIYNYYIYLLTSCWRSPTSNMWRKSRPLVAAIWQPLAWLQTNRLAIILQNVLHLP